MDSPHLPRPARSDQALFDHRRTAAPVSEVLDRPRIAAEPSSVPGAADILTADALEFLAELHERVDQRRRTLLEARTERQARFDAGELPDFPEETREIREAEWAVAPIPPDLLDRRVEITGPTN